MKKLLSTLLAGVCLLPSCRDESTKATALEPAQKTTQEEPVKIIHTQVADAVKIDASLLAQFQVLPDEMPSASNPLTEAKIDLGRMLYYETRLSKNQEISCNSCHQLDNFGVDSKPFSPGHKGQLGGRNSPTVYNAALHLAQFWDGREPDVEAQAKGPVLNPVEMAMPSADHVVKVLKSIPGYDPLFKKAFPESADAITYDNMAKAIGAFERKLVTKDRFDKFIKGDKTALNDAEKKGLKKFVEVGCTACHNGPALGGTSYMKLGLVKPWPNLKDEGRAAQGQKHFFKVPSLRNISKTGPYLHDGSVTDLKEMVSMMAEYQLGKKLSTADAESIATFLKALEGEVPVDYIKEPTLPANGPNTPKADHN